MVRTNLLQKLDASMRQRLQLPPGIGELKAQASLNQSELQLEQIRRRMALDERKQTESEARIVLRAAQMEGKILLQEQRARLFDFEIAKAELEVAQKRQRLESAKTSTARKR